MSEANRLSTLPALLGARGHSIGWRRAWAFYAALLTSGVLALLLERALRPDVAQLFKLPTVTWLLVAGVSPLTLAACAVAAFRYLRWQVAAALLGATAYGAALYAARLLLASLPLPSFAAGSATVAAWNDFSGAFFLLCGMVLALRGPAATWSRLAIGVALAQWAHQVVGPASPFALPLRSTLLSALFGLVSAGLFVALLWLSLELACASEGRASKRAFLGLTGGGLVLATLCPLLVFESELGDMVSIDAARPILSAVLRDAVLVDHRVAQALLIVTLASLLCVAVACLVLPYKLWTARRSGRARAGQANALSLPFAVFAALAVAGMALLATSTQAAIAPAALLCVAGAAALLVLVSRTCDAVAH